MTHFEGVMFRIVVATYLMIVAAAGPTACCCTLVRLATRHLPSPAPAVPTPAPCCHHAPPAQQSKDEPRRPAPGCPCKQAGGCEGVALPAAPDEALEASTRVGSGLFFFHLAIRLDRVALPNCGPSGFREGVGTSSRAISDQLLYTFHMLRC